MVFGEGLAADPLVERDFPEKRGYCGILIHRLLLAVELNLLVDDIVDERALDHELGGEIFEIPDLFRINDPTGFDIRGDVFEIVLAGAPVPDCVPGEGPGV